MLFMIDAFRVPNASTAYESFSVIYEIGWRDKLLYDFLLL